MYHTKSNAKLFTALTATVLLMAAAVPAVDSLYEDCNGSGLITDDSDAIAPLIIAGAWAGSIIATAIAAYWAGNHNSGGGSGIDVDAENHEQVEDFKLFVDTHFADLQGGMGIDVQTLKWTQMYWDRMAEVEVAERWTAGGDVSGHINPIIASSTFSENIGVHYRSWESVIDTPFEKMEDVPALNKANGYDEIEWGIYTDDQRHRSASTMSVDSGTFVDVKNGGNTVYLSTAGTDIEGVADAMDSVYVYRAGYLEGDFRDVDGNVQHAKKYLSPGCYTIRALGLTDGYYTLYDGAWIGPFLPAGEDAAQLTGALVTRIDGSSYGYVIPRDGGFLYYDGQTARTVSDFGMYAAYDDRDGHEVYTARSAVSLLGSWDALITEYEILAAGVAETIRAQWLLFDTVGSANPASSVTAYVPDMDNLEMSAEQRYAVALLSQIQNAEWYGSSSSQIPASDVRISESSLQLKCVGTIHDDLGNPVRTDVVFTPMVWLHDDRISVGTTEWTQKALAIVWGDRGTEEFSPSGMSLVYMSPGYRTEVSSMTYMGKDAGAVPLEVKSMDLVLSSFDHVYDPEPMPTDHTADTLLMVLMIVVGAALLFEGVRRGFLPLAAVGIVVIVAGLFFHRQIAGFIDTAIGFRSWFWWI